MIIWIASYPKSGNTWVRSFLASYYFSENGIFTVEDLYKIEDYPNKQFFPGINIKKWEIYKHWEESQKRIKKNNKIKFLKTHNSLINILGEDFTQPKYTLGIIYVIRDPRNVITSVKNHNSFKTYDEAFAFMKKDNTTIWGFDNDYSKTNVINSWRINYQSWTRKDKYKKMIVKYEDMLSKPEETFYDLVKFVNNICSFDKEIDKDKINNAIKTTSFDNLKKIEERGEFRETVHNLKTKEKKKFFYKGAENDWKKILDKKLAEDMTEYYKDDLKLFGYYEKN